VVPVIADGVATGVDVEAARLVATHRLAELVSGMSEVLGL
jgi:hypothetical protein